MTDRFQSLIQTLAASVTADYVEARQHAREKDPQRAGHEGEATWQRLIEQWGPNYPVVTRRYIVGPGGSTNEIDVVVLRPDYPRHLMNESSILVSGVAAAFSSKLTLRPQHVVEAIGQKKQVVQVAGATPSTVEEVLKGPFPFGLLAHSADGFAGGPEQFADRMQHHYDAVGHRAGDELVTHPSEELDAILVADRAFLSTARMSAVPDYDAPDNSWTPTSSLNRYADPEGQVGTPIAQFITWLNARCAGPDGSALRALEATFGADQSSGFMTRWPLEVYPQHLRDNISLVLNAHGHPLFFP